MADTKTVLSISDARKFYGSNEALKGVSLEVFEGEFLALVGPSGCGKTTLLKIIGGFEDLSKGRIELLGADMDGIPAKDRPTRMVFQRLALFPHMTIRDNISYPLKIARKSREFIDNRVHEMLTLMELSAAYLDRYPQQLSGGEQQRVALARCLASDPGIILLDEPLSALDVKLRKVLQAELKRLHRNLGVTFIHVTHDLEEALMLSDRICVMRDGQVQQIGSPHDIYYRPGNAFVAGFIGDTNIFDVEVHSIADDAVEFEWPVGIGQRHRIDCSQTSSELTTGPARMMVRPELMRLSKSKDDTFAMTVKIKETFNHGPTVQYVTTALHDDAQIVFDVQGESQNALPVGQEIPLTWSQDSVFVFQEEGPTV